MLLFATSETFAQNNFNVHVGVANPLGDFASEDIDSDKSGWAATGFNIGLKYTYQLSDNGLGLFAGLDFNSNGITKDFKRTVEEAFEDIGLLGAEYTFLKYYNIPISAGLNYTYGANEKVDLFANAGIVLNLLNISDFVIEGSGLKVTSIYDPASAFGFRVGGGILINKKVSVAVDYFGIGSHSINVKTRADGIPTDYSDFDQKVSLLTIAVGYNF